MAGAVNLNTSSPRSVPGILMPLPDHDFDPTEAAIPWKACISQGWQVSFSTEHAAVAQGDLSRLSGPLPGYLSASKAARQAYREMTAGASYQHPTSYSEIDPSLYQALLLPGGDAPGVRQYLDSTVLQSKVLEFCKQDKLVGALCHGILVLARTLDPSTGHSVLYGRKITVLPRSLDLLAYRLDRLLTRHGYIMYASCVADEVAACMEHPGDIIPGPGVFSPYAYADGNLVTSRWYLDAEVFAGKFIEKLHERLTLENVVPSNAGAQIS